MVLIFKHLILATLLSTSVLAVPLARITTNHALETRNTGNLGLDHLIADGAWAEQPITPSFAWPEDEDISPALSFIAAIRRFLKANKALDAKSAAGVQWKDFERDFGELKRILEDCDKKYKNWSNLKRTGERKYSRTPMPPSSVLLALGQLKNQQLDKLKKMKPKRVA